MAEIEIGQGDIGDHVVGEIVLFDGEIKDIGKMKLTQLGKESFELIFNGKKIKLIGSNKVGHA